MSNILNNTASLQGILEALQGKAAGGGAPVIEKDVNFYDYDGTLLYSYTLEEIQRASKLPDLPTREGLICQEWNWTLDELKALGRPMTVGATYITDDGATRIHIDLYDKSLLGVTLNYAQSIANGVTVDWGDGSERETYQSTGGVTLSHTYENLGSYTISMFQNNSCYFRLGHNNYSTTLLASHSGGGNFKSVVKEVNGGDGFVLGIYALNSYRCLEKLSLPRGSSYGEASIGGASRLRAIVIPRTTTSLVAYMFSDCTAMSVISLPGTLTKSELRSLVSCASLRKIELPNSFSTLSGTHQFYGCRGVLEIILPDALTSISACLFNGWNSLRKITMNKITSIGANAFNGCSSLPSICIPGTCTSIAENAFNGCSGIVKYDFSAATAVPTLVNTNAFTSINANCVFIVPDNLLDEWKAATNWSTYASYIKGASEV